MTVILLLFLLLALADAETEFTSDLIFESNGTFRSVAHPDEHAERDVVILLHYAQIDARTLPSCHNESFTLLYQIRHMSSPHQPIDMTEFLDYTTPTIAFDGKKHYCHFLFVPGEDYHEEEKLTHLRVTDGGRIQLTLRVSRENARGVTFVDSVHADHTQSPRMMKTESKFGSQSMLVWSYLIGPKINATTSAASSNTCANNRTLIIHEDTCPAWSTNSGWFVLACTICLLEFAIICGAFWTWSCVDWRRMYRREWRAKRRRKKQLKQQLLQQSYVAVTTQGDNSDPITVSDHVPTPTTPTKTHSEPDSTDDVNNVNVDRAQLVQTFPAPSKHNELI